jgi:hypothetical protein
MTGNGKFLLCGNASVAVAKRKVLIGVTPPKCGDLATNSAGSEPGLWVGLGPVLKFE